MYFDSRVAAGKMLASQLAPKYRDRPCAVVALGDGAVLVGAQIALELGCVLMLLITDTIELPREDSALAGLSQDGTLTYNERYSPGEIEDFVSEYHGFIEQERLEKLHHIHELAGHSLVRKDLLRDRNVIVVSDGLSSGFPLDIATAFLKMVSIKRLIVATPFASVTAVDRMHILADEICCLSVISDYISTDHYYDHNDLPPHQAVLKTVEHIVTNWRG